MEDEDRSKPLSIEEIVTETKAKPKVSDGRIPLPIGVGSGMGWSDKAMSGQRTYRDTDDDTPNGAVIGARITRTRR
jgi:hypothetical protein